MSQNTEQTESGTRDSNPLSNTGENASNSATSVGNDLAAGAVANAAPSLQSKRRSAESGTDSRTADITLRSAKPKAKRSKSKGSAKPEPGRGRAADTSHRRELVGCCQVWRNHARTVTSVTIDTFPLGLTDVLEPFMSFNGKRIRLTIEQLPEERS